MNERLRRRLDWRRSNATAPRRNRYRESKVNPPWWDDFWDTADRAQADWVQHIHDHVWEDDVDGD